MQLKGKRAGTKCWLLACPLSFALHANSARDGMSQQDITKQSDDGFKSTLIRTLDSHWEKPQVNLTLELISNTGSDNKIKMPSNLAQ